ncbi:hypothetical protein, conserved [Plasmodium gonderi]|uniref:Uncharacterized protein n=1 Tax=Plasmodium gonderi TaxID=77519 RepID=A0A1Y1JHT0_PLAGO|nr:hypothetical protein, conserved [Plasmodium gonderi]GAW82076.1 hypothetical protein, conserved [Plasmodium gonderi]
MILKILLLLLLLRLHDFSTICFSLKKLFLNCTRNSPIRVNKVNSKTLQMDTNYFCSVKKKYISPVKKFSLKGMNEDDENSESFKNHLTNTNIFRNKYNYIPSVDEVKTDIENFKKEKSFYFTEHSILEVVSIENNIVVINIEGMFFEDINVVFAEVTKYLLSKHLGILGVHPYNIKSLNIGKGEI